jgi:hypothetical protein
MRARKLKKRGCHQAAPFLQFAKVCARHCAGHAAEPLSRPMKSPHFFVFRLAKQRATP